MQNEPGRKNDAGFDRTYMSLIERGLSSPTIRAVLRLAAILKVKPSEIVIRMEALRPKEDKPARNVEARTEHGSGQLQYAAAAFARLL